MQLIPLDQIVISPNRQRREFDPQSLAELMDSIQSKGLFHPIVVRNETHEASDTNLSSVTITLVAGERRLRAIQDLLAMGSMLSFNGSMVPEGMVPTVNLGDLSPLDAEEAELEENIRRTDLTWQERAQATARLAELRRAQARSNGNAEPTTADISAEVRGSSEGIHHDETKQEIIVSKHLFNPEVAKARNLKEAYKVLRRQEEVKKNEKLAEHIGRTFSAGDHQLLQGDCLGLMQDMVAETFDVILSDPPYGMGADEFGDSGGRAPVGHAYKDDFETWCELMEKFSVECFRVAKQQSHLYLFCDVGNFGVLKNFISLAGWTVFRTPLIWHKPNGMRAPWPEHGPQRKYEVILYAMKGKKPVNKIFPDVMTYPSNDNLGHAAQKPVALFVDLLRRSSKPGDKVLDPFCGSGTIFLACQEMLCVATGIELDQAHYGLAAKRLEGLKK